MLVPKVPEVQSSRNGDARKSRENIADTQRLTAELLADLARYYRAYVTFQNPESDSLILAAWTLHTQTYHAGRYCTYLVITADSKNCGKSTLVSAINQVTPNSEWASSSTVAAIQRIQNQIVLIDEVNRILELGPVTRAQIYGWLDSGHTKGPSSQLADPRDPTKNISRSPFGPKVLTGTGINSSLDDSVLSRSIVIQLRSRDLANARVQVSDSILSGMATNLFKRVADWGNKKEVISAAKSASNRIIIDLPDGTAVWNRLTNIWSPILGICELAGTKYSDIIKLIMQDSAFTEDTVQESEAEHMDGKLRPLMSQGRLVITNYIDPAKPPIPPTSQYPGIGNSDFGWGSTRRKSFKSVTDLPDGSLVINEDKRAAALHFVAATFDQICKAMGTNKAAVTSAYRKAGRLQAASGKSNMRLAMHIGEKQIAVISIDVTDWFWPDQKIADQLMQAADEWDKD